MSEPCTNRYRIVPAGGYSEGGTLTRLADRLEGDLVTQVSEVTGTVGDEIDAQRSERRADGRALVRDPHN
jgi:hypothetical protein